MSLKPNASTPLKTARPEEPARGRLASAAESVLHLWYACPFRWQILIAITLLTLLTGVIGGILAVFDSRTRAAVETHSNVELWRHHITAKTRAIDGPADVGPFAERLANEMAQIRHVSIHVLNVDGSPVETAVPAETTSHPETEDGAPDWFVNLVQPTKDVTTIPIVVAGEHLGTVLIEGEPDDEIAEAWELLRLMALLWLGGTALMMVGLYFVLGHVLDPLVVLADGMRELEDGHYGLRIEPPKVRELATLAGSFNMLAAALDEANAENSRLYRQLVAVQEDERRQLSRDLHDEVGPCLFGITAGAGSIERQARNLPEEKAGPILSCVEEIVLMSERLKSLNRALLNRLRPVALGRVTLSELIGELILSVERRHLETKIERNIGLLPASFGEDIDLTIYRSVQEGLTNAMRHGSPTHVSIYLAMEETSAGPCVRLRITDNGSGISETAAVGFGLSGMRERVRALHGTLVIEPAKPGTALLVTLPVPNRGEESAPPPLFSTGADN
ncbi:MAG TPA: histidine kinase [Hyphomicrobium sp.]|nr:histidine kinase [Hyphomicrobium sp.]HRO49937.1 histidine kinase [Hyphomicrobium sp.]